MTEPPAATEALVARVLAAVRSVRYGTVELVIHDGRVVQLEKREKIRLTVPDQTAGDTPLTRR